MVDNIELNQRRNLELDMIEEEIEDLRNKLNEIYLSVGDLQNIDMIRVSQKLDMLHLEYEKQKKRPVEQSRPATRVVISPN